MNNLAESKSFLKNNIITLLFVGIIFCVTLFSVSTLLTKPRLWVDEAVTVELSHNFLKFGVLDIRTSPGHFSGIPYLFQSTGYPFTIFLSIVFKVFGYNLAMERSAMVAIMVVALIVIFVLGGKVFGFKRAILSVLLVATFSSFYGSGRTAVGEVPGFILLMFSLYFSSMKKSYYLGGLFLGLAIVTKPSVFLFALPALVIATLLDRHRFFRNMVELGLGMIPAALGWIFLVLGNPFSTKIWLTIINFYRNPFGTSSVSVNIFSNLLDFLRSTTLIYFFLLFLVILLSRCWAEDTRTKFFYHFVIVYSIFAYIYYLRSPGWLRYIVIAEYLILFLLPDALEKLFAKINHFIRLPMSSERAALLATTLLALMQLVQMLTVANIYASDEAIKTAAYINREFPSASVGLVNIPTVSLLLGTEKKYQIIHLVGIPAVGRGFLLNEKKPDIVIFGHDDICWHNSMLCAISAQERAILKKNYHLFSTMNGYDIYVSNKK